MSETYDLIVIGAGWFGLAAAKVYLELHPSHEILLVESSGSCGGTWAEDRIYPSLKSNNLHGTYEYPDFPMDPKIYGVNPGQHVPGEVLHQYLTDFARRFGVFSRTRFNTKVESVHASENDTWMLENTTNDQINGTLTTKRLILATGLTSTPNLPVYPGKDLFTGPYFHVKDLALNSATVQSSSNAIIIGGAKSAYAYAYASAGAQVHMVIRPTGKGPVWIAQPFVDFGLRLEKLLHVRALTCFSPCPWGAEAGYSWFRGFLHGTTIGRWLVDAFWGALGSSVITQNKYASHSETAKLQPWTSAFWIGSGLSIHNYEKDFFEMVRRGRVKVHIADVERLTEQNVVLTTGESLPADVVVCATGWKKEPSLKLLDSTSGALNMGLPHSSAESALLLEKADSEILTRFPRLQHQPVAHSNPNPANPYRLYRFIVPPTLVSQRNFAMAGMVSSVSTSLTAYAQALWISAFLDGKLNRLASDPQEIAKEVMLHTQWGRWRYPCGYGGQIPDFAFDALTYVDLLLGDLGVRVRRKGGMLKELFVPYGPEDYGGLVGEWVDGHMGRWKDGGSRGDVLQSITKI